MIANDNLLKPKVLLLNDFWGQIFIELNFFEGFNKIENSREVCFFAGRGDPHIKPTMCHTLALWAGGLLDSFKKLEK